MYPCLYQLLLPTLDTHHFSYFEHALPIRLYLHSQHRTGTDTYFDMIILSKPWLMYVLFLSVRARSPFGNSTPIISIFFALRICTRTCNLQPLFKRRYSGTEVIRYCGICAHVAEQNHYSVYPFAIPTPVCRGEETAQ
jgi:hypothetical protein